jgi:hypothetical protein
MKPTKLLPFALLASTLLAVACIKNYESSLPPETQEGKNTFGCYVDGDIFLADESFFGLVHPVAASYKNSTGYLTIEGINGHSGTSPVAGIVTIRMLNVFDQGDFSLIYEPRDDGRGMGGHYWGNKNGLFLAENGILTITKLDTINRIVSGRFYFTGRDSTEKVTEITKGRFDIVYWKDKH